MGGKPLMDLYDDILKEKATFKEFEEFVFRLTIRSIDPDTVLALIRARQLEEETD